MTVIPVLKNQLHNLYLFLSTSASCSWARNFTHLSYACVTVSFFALLLCTGRFGFLEYSFFSAGGFRGAFDGGGCVLTLLLLVVSR
jgi:hypothetical protein